MSPARKTYENWSEPPTSENFEPTGEILIWRYGKSEHLNWLFEKLPKDATHWRKITPPK